MSDSLALDVDRISREALRTIAAGPVADRAGLDTERVISVLNDVVAAEVVAWLRYTRHSVTARRGDRSAASDRFDALAERAMRHATAVADRITQLGGRPNFDPATLAQRAHTDYSVTDASALRTLWEQNLQATRIVVAAYRSIIGWLGDQDRQTRELMESLLADERRSEQELAAQLAP
ncbi:ferritin-like domain-containing protein [Kitasatospora sp. NPDC048540]|uniref:ferritin-like domain-containing protein n=1 Tax=unclassified Kitasatospora TaxID=2633591 RepID=UPI00068BC9F6|nr:ferritin-like domain-containing protein [Kitasatospora sp. MBT63]